MFGWHEDDIAEMESVRKMFESIDVDGGGALDKTETNSLFRKLRCWSKALIWHFNLLNVKRCGRPPCCLAKWPSFRRVACISTCLPVRVLLLSRRQEGGGFGPDRLRGHQFETAVPLDACHKPLG